MKAWLKFVAASVALVLTMVTFGVVLIAWSSVAQGADRVEYLQKTGGLCDFAHRVMMAGSYYREQGVPFSSINIKWHGDESNRDREVFMTYLRRGYSEIRDTGEPLTPIEYEALRVATCRGATQSQLP